MKHDSTRATANEVPARSDESTPPAIPDSAIPRLAHFDVPGVGPVDVLLHEHKFGMTGETIVMLQEVYRANGLPAGCEVHERTAEYLETVGILH